MSTLADIRTRPLKPGFGAEILDVDIRTADIDTLQGVVRTFHRHGAIVLRDQTLTPGELTDFVAQFGEPEDHTLLEYTVPGFPKVFRLSNRIVDGKPIGSHNDGVGWHTDYSYKPEPVMSTMLYAVEVPAEGADTLLADCVAAWASLPPERQAELDGKVLHHSYQHFMATRQYGARELSEELKAQNPDVFHPLVRTHPADGRKALWPSTGTVMEVVGMPNPEGLELIDELVEYATQDRFVYRHKWRVGDVLMWDNRCTLHTGTLFDDTKYIREMHRLWVRGDKPF
ncbi:TauD/TfdA family dioxygenase [Phenylobacterium sp. LjRoot225]|uniref:TauD/TfdA dioxygenase family protein n=1 Tax=Phenylobacterium sp. LjRoot225 TaxID=3342285 RepID=UPI003ECF0A7B